MSFLLAPPYMTILDEDGNPVSGGKIHFYLTGTTTPATIYADSGLITPLANPVIADSAGRCDAVYLDSNVTYRCKTTTAAGTTIRDVDPIIGLGSSPSIPVAASTTEQLTGTNTTKFATPDSVAALWEKGADIASAGTITLGEGGMFHVTGTTTITDIDPATDKAGRAFKLIFDGALTLTHNATTLILPAGANITTAAGDVADFVSEGSDAVRCVSYQKASGLPLVAPTAASTTEQLTGTDSAKYTTPDSVAALWEQGADVASAGTLSLGEGGYFNVTGTTTITDIDFATDKAGRKAWVKFAGVLTLTNGASLILPTGANISTAAGDTACFVSEGSDVVRCVAYQRASGTALSIGSGSGHPFEYTVACSDESTALTTGTAKVTFRMPCAVTLTGVRASVNTAPTGSTLIVDINEAGSTILSTKLSIDASEKTSTTAASAAVISDTGLADDAEIQIDIDQVGSTVAGAGLKVTLIGTRV